MGTRLDTGLKFPNKEVGGKCGLRALSMTSFYEILIGDTPSKAEGVDHTDFFGHTMKKKVVTKFCKLSTSTCCTSE